MVLKLLSLGKRKKMLATYDAHLFIMVHDIRLTSLAK